MPKHTTHTERAKKLRLILGDQLNHNHSWFNDDPSEADYAIMEVQQETDYVIHHVQKVIGFFLAMRSFCSALRNRGFTVHYISLGDEENKHSFLDNLQSLINENTYSSFEYQLPDEYRLDKYFSEISNHLTIPVSAADSEHFFTTRSELGEMFKGKKQFLMETFYRNMRRKHGVLMDGSEPEGGQWNFDSDNRNKLNTKVSIPTPLSFSRDVSEIYSLIVDRKIKTMGSVDAKKFNLAVTRDEGLLVLEFFCEKQLLHFGTYQDAMHTDERVMFHSQLSFLMNVKLLSPLEVINRVVTEWRSRSSEISLPQVEGFVRQIIGWREYMRGMYWAKMPEFATQNFFSNTRKLPGYFWSGETNLNCVKHVVNQSLETAYAHHIQRLMITGNFTLLTGIDPAEVDAWYLGIYIDAIEWVQLPNTRGMSQFADGGVVATKPYVSSANYIHKMSNYCESCFYKRDQRVGEKACPFNSLYWNFMIQHRQKLEKNHRIGMVYRTLDKMGETDKAEIVKSAKKYLREIENL